MKKFKMLIGSIYVRFLAAFLGSFIFSILIAVLVINTMQFGNVKKMVSATLESKAYQIKNLVDNENISINKAIGYLSNSEVNEAVWPSIRETGIILTSSEIQSIENGNVVSNIDYSSNVKSYSIFKLDNEYIVITPNIKNSLLILFFSMQRISTLIPIILGTVIIFLATITVVRPIKLISEASKKVAGGDFSIQLPIKGNTEVSELTRNFNLMVKELSANEYLHKEFVSNVSHEFKTPITSLKGYAKLLKCEDLPDDKRQEYADIIISESERLSNLSSKLLKLSELENEIIRNKREQFSLDEQIRDAILLLQNEWEKKNLELDVDMEEVTFKGYKELMALVWINLISNAIKYSGQGDLLKITLRQTDKITIEIRDSGIGMTKEDAGKIFRRFYKADKSRNGTGTGLGLSIVKKIIELHDGTIYVDSEPGKGSTFVVALQ